MNGSLLPGIYWLQSWEDKTFFAVAKLTNSLKQLPKLTKSLIVKGPLYHTIDLALKEKKLAKNNFEKKTYSHHKFAWKSLCVYPNLMSVLNIWLRPWFLASVVYIKNKICMVHTTSIDHYKLDFGIKSAHSSSIIKIQKFSSDSNDIVYTVRNITRLIPLAQFIDWTVLVEF